MMIVIVIMMMMMMMQKKGCAPHAHPWCLTLARHQGWWLPELQETRALLMFKYKRKLAKYKYVYIFRKPRRTDSKSNYLSSWQTQNHMYFKDSMYAMQCLFRRFYQKKMSNFLPRRLSFWISLWFHVPLEVAVALSSDRWPLRKAKKRARTSRMAWSSMEAAGRKFQVDVGKNVKHGQQWAWEQQFCSHKKCTTIALLSIYWREQPPFELGWILYNHSNSSSVLPLLVTGDFWQLGFEVLI